MTIIGICKCCGKWITSADNDAAHKPGPKRTLCDDCRRFQTTASHDIRAETITEHQDMLKRLRARDKKFSSPPAKVRMHPSGLGHVITRGRVMGAPGEIHLAVVCPGEEDA